MRSTTVTSTLCIVYSPSCAILIPVPCLLTVVHESQGQQGPPLVALIKFEGTLLKDRVNYSKHKDVGMSRQSEKPVQAGRSRWCWSQFGHTESKVSNTELSNVDCTIVSASGGEGGI